LKHVQDFQRSRFCNELIHCPKKENREIPWELYPSAL